MPLASFTFLYLFLPVSLAVYYLFPQRMRYGVLLGISLVFFLLGDPVSLLFLSVSATVDYGLGLLMEHFDEQNPRRRAIMVVMVAKNLLFFSASPVFASCMACKHRWVLLYAPCWEPVMRWISITARRFMSIIGGNSCWPISCL